LAAEAAIPYAAIGVVTNFAAGIKKTRISADEVIKVMSGRQRVLADLLAAVIKTIQIA